MKNRLLAKGVALLVMLGLLMLGRKRSANDTLAPSMTAC